MEVAVLGTGSMDPYPGRGAPAYAVRGPDGVILLDTGPGSCRHWPGVELQVRDIKGVFISHFHPDHVCDLAYVLFLRRYYRPRAQGEMPVIGPPGLNRFYDGLCAAYGRYLVPRDDQDLKITEARNGRFAVAGMDVDAMPVKHDAESVCLGFRVIHDNRTLAYTGDTGFGTWLDPVLEDADLALVECSLPETSQSDRHLNAVQAGAAAAGAGVKKLGLVHLKGDVDEDLLLSQAKKAFTGHVFIPPEDEWMRI